jgi:hypothetical protein
MHDFNTDLGIVRTALIKYTREETTVDFRFFGKNLYCTFTPIAVVCAVPVDGVAVTVIVYVPVVVPGFPPPVPPPPEFELLQPAPAATTTNRRNASEARCHRLCPEVTNRKHKQNRNIAPAATGHPYANV